MTRFTSALLAAILLAPAAGAQPIIRTFAAGLNGTSVVPSTSSDAAGIMMMTYVDDTFIDPFIVVGGSFAGLEGDYLDASLRYGVIGANGPIVQSLVPTLRPGNRSGTWEEGDNVYDVGSDFLDDLENGLIHGIVYTGTWSIGEIRAQFWPAPELDGTFFDPDTLLYETIAAKQNANAGFGPDIDVDESLFWLFEGDSALSDDDLLFIGVKGKLNTTSLDGIGIWVNVDGHDGAPAGSPLGGLANTGHFLAAPASNYTADSEVDYALILNTGATANSVFLDGAKYSATGPTQTDYFGQTNQFGIPSFGPPDDVDNAGGEPIFGALAFAFDNSGGADTGLELVIPARALGIDGTENFSDITISAFVVSATAYFSNVMVPGDITAGNPGFDPSFNANSTSIVCACPSPSSTIGAGPYHATAALGTNPDFDLKATALSSLSVPAGGSVQFQYTVTNNTPNSASGQLYYTATGGRQGIIQSGSVGPNTTLGPLTFTQAVPASTPPGTYTYTLNIGSSPSTSVDAESFTLTVTPAPRQTGGLPGWTVVDAQPWTDTATASVAASDAVTVSPNPLASTARLAFSLDARTDVTLSVFDVQGREVARLVDGALGAGTHTATLDASALPSGVYVYRLTTGTSVDTGRLAVLR